MDGYSEVINLHKLNNNHTKIDFVFKSKSEVVVDCEGWGNCATDVDTLPLPIYALLSDSKASHISFYAPSGDWNDRLWGLQPSTFDNINAGSSHTSMVATTPISHWPTLRAHLATLLHIPLNPSRVDTNHHPIKLSVKSQSTSGITSTASDEDTTFGQFFPLQSANADIWKAWSQNFLPCHGKSGIGTLLDAHTLHDSLWYGMSLDVSIHRSVTVPQCNSNMCTKSMDINAKEANVCAESNNSGSINYLNETEPGKYRVEVKVSVSMVVPTITAARNKDVETTSADTAYSASKEIVNVLDKIKRASYIMDKTQALCSVNNIVPTIRYYNTSNSNAYVAVPLSRAKETHNSDQKALDSFWNIVHSRDGSGMTKAADSATERNNSNVQSECTHGVTLRRKVYDPRAMEFKVVTTILPTHFHLEYACLNTSTTAHVFHEPLSDSYTIDLSQYRYTMVSTISNSNTSINNYTIGISEGFVKDLVGFEWIEKDCKAVAGGDYSRSDDIAMVAQECQPTYAFTLPTLPPNTGLLLTYTAYKRLLSREHQPYDASRGAVIPPSVLYSCSAITGFTCRIQSTRSFLMTSPIPDSSMPYNVITLVSTLLAFFLGSFINALHKNSKKNVPMPK